MLNSLGHVTSLPTGSPVVGLPPFSLWTGVFCSIFSADDGRASFVTVGCATGK